MGDTLNIRSIDLTNRVPSNQGIGFVRADMVADRYTRLAVVFYQNSKGENADARSPRYGLRLDLDKLVFLDHLDDDTQDKYVTEQAPEIARIIVEKVLNVV